MMVPEFTEGPDHSTAVSIREPSGRRILHGAHAETRSPSVPGPPPHLGLAARRLWAARRLFAAAWTSIPLLHADAGNRGGGRRTRLRFL